MSEETNKIPDVSIVTPKDIDPNALALPIKSIPPTLIVNPSTTDSAENGSNDDKNNK